MANKHSQCDIYSGARFVPEKAWHKTITYINAPAVGVMAKLIMKYLLVIGSIFWSALAFSSQEHRYEWESITYKTYLHELKKKAVLTASMKYSDEHGHGVLHSLDLRVGKKRFVFPKHVIQEYGLIHPHSFRISAGDFTDEEEQRWVTVYFQYGLHPKIKEGSISFLNGKYRLRSIQEEAP